MRAAAVHLAGEDAGHGDPAYSSGARSRGCRAWKNGMMEGGNDGMMVIAGQAGGDGARMGPIGHIGPIGPIEAASLPLARMRRVDERKSGRME